MVVIELLRIFLARKALAQRQEQFSVGQRINTRRAAFNNATTKMAVLANFSLWRNTTLTCSSRALSALRVARASAVLLVRPSAEDSEKQKRSADYAQSHCR